MRKCLRSIKGHIVRGHSESWRRVDTWWTVDTCTYRHIQTYIHTYVRAYSCNHVRTQNSSQGESGQWTFLWFLSVLSNIVWLCYQNFVITARSVCRLLCAYIQPFAQPCLLGFNIKTNAEYSLICNFTSLKFIRIKIYKGQSHVIIDKWKIWCLDWSINRLY